LLTDPTSLCTTSQNAEIAVAVLTTLACCTEASTGTDERDPLPGPEPPSDHRGAADAREAESTLSKIGWAISKDTAPALPFAASFSMLTAIDCTLEAAVVERWPDCCDSAPRLDTQPDMAFALGSSMDMTEARLFAIFSRTCCRLARSSSVTEQASKVYPAVHTH